MIDRMAKIGFTFFLLALTALLFYLTLDLSRIARLVPLWVVIPTLGLLLQQLIADVTPKRVKGRHHPRAPWLLAMARQKQGGDNGIKMSAGRQPSEVHLAGHNLIWLSWMVISIYLLGQIFAVSLYALLYLRLRAGQGWRSSIVVAASTGFILYALIVHVFGKALYGGQLWIWIGWL